jgi:hypothetical protein
MGRKREFKRPPAGTPFRIARNAQENRVRFYQQGRGWGSLCHGDSPSTIRNHLGTTDARSRGQGPIDRPISIARFILSAPNRGQHERTPKRVAFSVPRSQLSLKPVDIALRDHLRHPTIRIPQVGAVPPQVRSQKYSMLVANCYPACKEK